MINGFNALQYEDYEHEHLAYYCKNHNYFRVIRYHLKAISCQNQST